MNPKEAFDFKRGGWWTGCTCSAANKIVPPEGSVALMFEAAGELVGAVTGLQYSVVPQFYAIDIDERDAEVFLSEGKAGPLPLNRPYQAAKGYLSRG